LIEALKGDHGLTVAELRPPRAALGTRAGMDAWIDTYHAVRRLTRRGGWVFLTDSAVGSQEEDNLRHLVANLGRDVPREHIVPFLTAKHTLEYCLSYADRAVHHGFPGLVVLGGDKSVGPPRCVAHAWELRQLIRARQPSLVLGGWANPHGDPVRQVEYLLDPRNAAEFYLTQIVSHHQLGAVEGFLNEGARRGLTLPGLFGVFYYRSANVHTLESLSEFLPVPREGLAAEFGAGATPEDVCARTLHGLWRAGVRHVYVSNLPLGRAHEVLHNLTSRMVPG
jgi:hypothetical protein